MFELDDEYGFRPPNAIGLYRFGNKNGLFASNENRPKIEDTKVISLVYK